MIGMAILRTKYCMFCLSVLLGERMHGCNNEVTSKHAIKGQSSGRLKLCSLFIQRQTRLDFNDSTSLIVTPRRTTGSLGYN